MRCKDFGGLRLFEERTKRPAYFAAASGLDGWEEAELGLEQG
jgi:hypothetical protein